MKNEVTLKPCPLCGAKAEFDGAGYYRNITTSMIENQSSVYCTGCELHLSMCHRDVPDLSHEDIRTTLESNWNRRVSG